MWPINANCSFLFKIKCCRVCELFVYCDCHLAFLHRFWIIFRLFCGKSLTFSEKHRSTKCKNCRWTSGLSIRNENQFGIQYSILKLTLQLFKDQKKKKKKNSFSLFFHHFRDWKLEIAYLHWLSIIVWDFCFFDKKSQHEKLIISMQRVEKRKERNWKKLKENFYECYW